jgi:hypothetical protein
LVPTSKTKTVKDDSKNTDHERGILNGVPLLGVSRIKGLVMAVIFEKYTRNIVPTPWYSQTFS